MVWGTTEEREVGAWCLFRSVSTGLDASGELFWPEKKGSLPGEDWVDWVDWVDWAAMPRRDGSTGSKGSTLGWRIEAD
jgi:hypothetical protein